MTGRPAGRVPNEWYAEQYRAAIKKKAAEAPPLTLEAQQLIRRLLGTPAQEPAPTPPIKKVRRVCRQAQTLRAYRRYQAGA